MNKELVDRIAQYLNAIAVKESLDPPAILFVGNFLEVKFYLNHSCSCGSQTPGAVAGAIQTAPVSAPASHQESKSKQIKGTDNDKTG